MSIVSRKSVAFFLKILYMGNTLTSTKPPTTATQMKTTAQVKTQAPTTAKPAVTYVNVINESPVTVWASILKDGKPGQLYKIDKGETVKLNDFCKECSLTVYPKNDTKTSSILTVKNSAIQGKTNFTIKSQTTYSSSDEIGEPVRTTGPPMPTPTSTPTPVAMTLARNPTAPF